jgi:hypothetical protein
VYVSPDQAVTDFDGLYGPEEKIVGVKVLEGQEANLWLAYATDTGATTAIPLIHTFRAVNTLGPAVPADAMSVLQVGVEVVELPDPTVIAPETVVEPPVAEEVAPPVETAA